MIFNDFPPHSKIWIYQADREISSTEIAWANEQIATFCQEWTSHGAQLQAKGLVFNSFTIVLAVNVDEVNSSGCSIDKSVHFIKSLGAELQVNFFNRLNSWILENGEIKKIPYRELKNYPEAFYFDPSIATLNAFKDHYSKAKLNA